MCGSVARAIFATFVKIGQHKEYDGAHWINLIETTTALSGG